MRYDDAPQNARWSETQLAQQLDLLNRAIEVDPGFAQTYKRLANLTNKSSENELLHFTKNLQSIITRNQVNALDEYSLAHAHWQLGEDSDSQWHLDQAWMQDEDFARIAAPLAKAILELTPDDTEWAFKLAKKSTEASPGVAAYHELLGSILLYQSKFEEAITELTLALCPDIDNSSVHAKIASAYHNLGDLKRSQFHQQQGLDQK